MMSKNRLWIFGAGVGVLAVVFLVVVMRSQDDHAAPVVLPTVTALPSPTPLPTKAAQTASPIPGIPAVSGFYTPVPVDAPATSLPKNGALFFLWGSDLYTAHNDGTGLTQLAEKFDLTHFALAPDGQRIVFAGHAADQRVQDNVYVMNPDGSRIIELVNNVGYSPEPIQWSPNSEKIAFQSGGTIYIVSISDGSIIGVSPGQSNNSPRWSPDSQTIAFLSGMTGVEALAIMNADGSDIRYPLGGLLPRKIFFWVPGSRQLVFISSPAQTYYVFDADSYDVARLEAPIIPNPLAWSPDGQQVVMLREDGLYKVDVDGSNESRLAEGDFQVFSIRWSPDGQRIAVVAWTEPTPAPLRVFVMDADGNHFTDLLPEAASTDMAVWSPDGRFLLFYSQQEDETLTGVYKLSLADSTTERLPLDKFSLEMVWQALP